MCLICLLLVPLSLGVLSLCLCCPSLSLCCPLLPPALSFCPFAAPFSPPLFPSAPFCPFLLLALPLSVPFCLSSSLLSFLWCSIFPFCAACHCRTERVLRVIMGLRRLDIGLLVLFMRSGGACLGFVLGKVRLASVNRPKPLVSSCCVFPWAYQLSASLHPKLTFSKHICLNQGDLLDPWRRATRAHSNRRRARDGPCMGRRRTASALKITNHGSLLGPILC